MAYVTGPAGQKGHGRRPARLNRSRATCDSLSAYQALLVADGGAVASGGIAYAIALLLIVRHYFERNVYRLYD